MKAKEVYNYFFKYAIMTKAMSTFLFLFLFFVNCSGTNRVNPGDAKKETNNGTGNKVLVVYFSMPETNKPDNMTTDEANSTVVIDGKVLGNTQYVALLIQENTGADIFRLEPKTPYPTNHSVLVDLAKKEKNENIRPELAKKVDSIEQYDIVFLGYPNWWGDMPMIIYSFLENYDLSGKTIIPFNTHGGSGFSNTISAIAKLQPNAKVEKNGFTVSRNTVDKAKNGVIDWLRSLKIAE